MTSPFQGNSNSAGPELGTSSRGGVEGHAASSTVRETATSRSARVVMLRVDRARSQPTWKERVGKAVASAGFESGPREAIFSEVI